MTCLLVGVWIIGTALFAFSVVEFALSALRMISGRRRNRRIWHGPRRDPPEPPDKSRYGVHRARAFQIATGVGAISTHNA